MVKFYETPCTELFKRTFVLELSDKRIGGASLVYVPTGATSGRLEVRDFELRSDDPILSDLLAGAILNAACNTEVGTVRVPKGAQWARFGLTNCGDYLETDTDKIIFDSVCKSRQGGCASCTQSCKERVKNEK